MDAFYCRRAEKLCFLIILSLSFLTSYDLLFLHSVLGNLVVHFSSPPYALLFAASVLGFEENVFLFFDKEENVFLRQV